MKAPNKIVPEGGHRIPLYHKPPRAKGLRLPCFAESQAELAQSSCQTGDKQITQRDIDAAKLARRISYYHVY